MAYACEDARKDIRFAFSDEPEDLFGEKTEALLRFSLHTTEPKPGGGEKILCNECWEYGQNLEKEQESQKKAD